MDCCFTICSNNYIYKAQVLAASIKAYSDTSVFLFLADAKNAKIDYTALGFTKVFFLEEIGISNLQWMKENYQLVELNTAIKPFAFNYLFTRQGATHVYFFDPDVKLFQSVDFFRGFWGNNSVLLTPHILTPLPFDKKMPDENLFLNHGIYNLGFLGLKNTDITRQLVDWWAQRSYEKCVIDLREGYFVDQLWFNLVPLFFKAVTVIEHKGCNAAYWNLHERKLFIENNSYKISDQESLVFFHFSGVGLRLENMSKLPNFRYSFEDRPVLKQLYQEYIDQCNEYKPNQFLSISYFDGKYPLSKPQPSITERIVKKIKSILLDA
jgi:hypothetical protein